MTVENSNEAPSKISTSASNRAASSPSLLWPVGRVGELGGVNSPPGSSGVTMETIEGGLFLCFLLLFFTEVTVVTRRGEVGSQGKARIL